MISVVIATHNGAPTLPLMLEALKAVELPAEGVEIIAVDNASEDGTTALLAEYQEVLPLTVLSEPRRGKSFALNRALAAARGDFVVFSDDDILPDPQWLEAYRQAAERQPDVDLFAGQVRHFWQKEPPHWLQRLAEEGRSYAGTPIDLAEGPIGVEIFKGANFMVRRRVLENIRFSERAGMNFGEGGAAGGEDSAFVHQALTRGYHTHYVPRACVRHIVRPYQIGLQPVLLRYLRIGRAMALSNPDQFDPKSPRLLGYPRYIFKSVPRNLLNALRHWVRGDPHGAAGELIVAAMTYGRAQQWRRDRSRIRRSESLSE